MRRRRAHVRVRRAWPVLAVAAAAALIRAPLLGGQPPWADEYFSLAMATGHGLEHPAHEADPTRGDFVEHEGPRPVDDYARYLALDPAAGADRVLDAVRRSDTNPPLYYLGLAAWLSAVGASEAGLRSFSLVASLLTLVPLAWLARRTIGRRGAVPACALFAVLPTSVYYGTEGRMYALLVLLATTTLALAVRFHRRGVSPTAGAAFVLVATAGLLTHHFFVFALAGPGAWLLAHPGRASRARVVALGLAAAALVSPWYVQVPALASAWRVTGGWLHVRPPDHHALLTPLALPWSFFATRGVWGGRLVVELVQLVAVAPALLVALRARREPGPRLLWLAMLVPCASVLALDLALGTYAAYVTRYALTGLPAAVLLLTLGLLRRTPRERAALALLILAASLVGVRRMAFADSRHDQPFRAAARLVLKEARPGDLVLVHSIPSCVAGVARELRLQLGTARGPDLAAWVGQLGQRDEDDLRALVRGRERVLLLEVHRVGDPARPRAWLMTHGRLEQQVRRGGVQLRVFRVDGREVTK